MCIVGFKFFATPKEIMSFIDRYVELYIYYVLIRRSKLRHYNSFEREKDEC